MDSKDRHNQKSPAPETQLRQLDDPAIKQILEHHRQWVDTRGEDRQAATGPADLSQTDLTGLNLAGADLQQANLKGACLQNTDLSRANLHEANLSGADLVNTRLQDADLRDANLKDADVLLCRQLAGADLAGARLPGIILKFEGLEIVEQISRNARTIMFSMLLACVYTWLTIATTTDPMLLTNSISSPLPIIQTEIPIAGFFWVAPLILMGFYLYFHLYLQRLWEALADLPAVFPDGTRLDKRAYPWLLNSLVTFYFKRLQDSRPQFSRLQTGVSVLIGWCTVPVTLLILWLRYLPRHDWLGTTLQVTLTLGATGAGILFFRVARATLRRKIQPAASLKPFFQSTGGAKQGVFVCGMAILLFTFSFGAIHGIPHGTDQAAGISSLDARLWVPRLMEVAGIGTRVDFIEENISVKPAGWVEKKGDGGNLGLIKGARLKHANLVYAMARNTFLVKADLRRANLFGADLEGADLRQANLTDANLNYSNLKGARLTGAILKGARLQGVNLTRQDFRRADLQGINLGSAYLQDIKFDEANLQGANFEKAQLQKIRFNSANLKNANFSKARLDEVFFTGANFQGIQLYDVRGLTRKEVFKTANWIFAGFDKNNLEALGLPEDLVKKVQQKKLVGMNLTGILFKDVDLQLFNFHKSNLLEARFYRVNMQGTDFSQANLNGAGFDRVDLQGADFRQASLHKSEIKKSDLNRANLQKANLKVGLLTEVDLRNANLAQANLSGVSFYNWVKIDGADLKGADFTSSHIKKAKGLTCKQIQNAVIDNRTRLPDDLGSCEQ